MAFFFGGDGCAGDTTRRQLINGSPAELEDRLSKALDEFEFQLILKGERF